MKDKEYFDGLQAEVEAERQNEEAYYHSLSITKSYKERVESGIMWYPVVISQRQYTLGDYVEIELERTKNFDFKHKFKEGVGCSFFIEGEERKSYRGIFSRVRKDKVRVLVKAEALEDDVLPSHKLGVELIYDERPYQEMRKALIEAQECQLPAIKAFKEILVRNDFQQYKLKDAVLLDSHKLLNPSQLAAVNGALEMERLAVLHGPPGTGKTTTLVTLIQSLAKQKGKVLVCAPSNNAVDLLAERLDKVGVKVVRVGNVSRVGDEILHLTVADKARRSTEWKHIKKVKIEADEAKRQAERFKRSFDQQKRQERQMLYKEARQLRKWAKDLEVKLLESILEDADVIATTLVGSVHPLIADMKYSTCVIDEASQALEPACWIPMLRAEKVVLAGDHMQLAPTVKSTEAEKLGLGITILDKVANKLPASYLLDTQYRMNEKILSFSNAQFYNSALKSSEKAANRTLPNDNSPLVLIDTSGCGFTEQQQHRSKFNPDELGIIREHVTLNKEKLLGSSIGIITPYAQQVRFIKQEIQGDDVFADLDIEVNSIDGFQGQEKAVIYISLVRSNDDGEIGFLKDYRRINVALTRAQQKLIIVGDISTLSSDSFYDKLAVHVESEGKYETAWEYMSY